MPPEVENDNLDNLSDDDLAKARGDALPEPETTPEPEPETTPEPEPETTPEPEPETTPEPEPEARKPIMLPKSRFDAAMARARAAEERVAELEAVPAPAEPATPEPSQEEGLAAQLAEIDDKIADAMNDGDTKATVALMQEQRALQTQATTAQIEASRVDTSSIKDETRAEILFDDLVARLAVAHPEFDTVEGNEVYDGVLVTQVNRLMNGFIAQGTDNATALEEALSYVYPEGWDKAPAEPVVPVGPAVKPKTTDIDKNLKAAEKQPPEMVGGDKSSDAGMKTQLNPMKLSDKDFEAMSDEQLADLRGDNFAVA